MNDEKYIELVNSRKPKSLPNNDEYTSEELGNLQELSNNSNIPILKIIKKVFK